MATLEDVAKLSGVAKATVSRALRNDSTLKLSPDTREKIINSARQVGYEAKSKKNNGEKKTILVIHKDDHFQNQIDNAFYFSMRTGIENACLANAFLCNFVPYSMLDDAAKEYSGAIIIGNFKKPDLNHILKKLDTTKIVFSGLMNFFPEKMDWITYDVIRAEELLLEYLNKMGKKKIAYFGGAETPGIQERYSKFHIFNRVLSRYDGMECVGAIHGAQGAQSGYRMMKQWLEEGRELPEAIATSNDPIAFGVLRAMAEEGINRKCSIISINGDSSGEITNPTLTSVNVHTTRIGEQAVWLLKSQMEQERKYYIKIEITPEIVERDSVV